MAKAVILKNVLTRARTVQELLDLLKEHEVPTTARIDYQNCGSHEMVVWTDDAPEYTPWWEFELDADENDDIKVVDCYAQWKAGGDDGTPS